MTCDVCHSDLPEGALFCGECGSSVYTQIPPARPSASDTEVLPRFLDDSADPGAPRSRPAPAFATPLVEAPVPAPVSAPAPVPAPAPAPVPQPTFTFTLSTGESLEIFSNGLLGRMPQPREGEEFEHLIIVTDPARSVSKTHLEFGFDDGQLWVLDRNSGNGSVIRETGKIPRRADPGRKYRVTRGARIELGDQHLLIS